MTEFSTVYGSSLYALACKEALCERIRTNLDLIDAVLRKQPAYVSLLDTPSVTQEEKCALLDRAFSGYVHPYTLNFLKIIAGKKKVHTFSAIRRTYLKCYYADHNIEEAVVITAVPLSDVLFEKLKAKLSKMTGKQIVLKNKVDKQIIGGLTVRMANRQIDASVRSRLNALEKQLAERW